MSHHARCGICSAGVLEQLRDEGLLTGWRSELYPVLTSFHAQPLALVERAAAVQLGIKAYGVHVNGYVVTERGIELWVATRSRSKPTWPGRLDHIVAGGQVSLCSCFHNPGFSLAAKQAFVLILGKGLGITLESWWQYTDVQEDFSED